MRKRQVKKLLRNPKRRLFYGLHRSRGHRSRRRGRRSVLRQCPELRDHSHLPSSEQLRLIIKTWEKLTGRTFEPTPKPMRFTKIEHKVHIKLPELEPLTPEQEKALHAKVKEFGELVEAKMRVKMLDAMGIPEGPARYPFGFLG